MGDLRSTILGEASGLDGQERIEVGAKSSRKPALTPVVDNAGSRSLTVTFSAKRHRSRVNPTSANSACVQCDSIKAYPFADESDRYAMGEKLRVAWCKDTRHKPAHTRISLRKSAGISNTSFSCMLA